MIDAIIGQPEGILLVFLDFIFKRKMVFFRPLLIVDCKGA